MKTISTSEEFSALIGSDGKVTETVELSIPHKQCSHRLGVFCHRLWEPAGRRDLINGCLL